MNLFEPWLLPIDCCTCANSSFSPPIIPLRVLPSAMNPKPLEVCDVIKDEDASLGMIPEGGDACTIVAQIPDVNKYASRKLEESEENVKDLLARFQISQCPLLRLSNKLSGSIIDKALYSYVGLVERGVLGCEIQPESLSVESSGFPYYRTYKSCGGFQDIVLVKDAGISCTLLGPDMNSSRTSTGRGSTLLEGFLLNQLRMECSDISEITKKISSYTKDILQSLSLKKKKNDKNSIVDMQLPRSELNPVAMQYIDTTGRPCLKLRLVKSKKLFTPVKLRQHSWWNLNIPRKDSNIITSINETNNEWRQQTGRAREQRNKLIKSSVGNQKRNRCFELMRPWTRESKFDVPRLRTNQVRQLYPKEPVTVELESSTCSSSSIYDFLMMRNRRTLIKRTTEQSICSGFQNHAGSNRLVISDSLDKNRSRKSITRTGTSFPIGSCRDTAKVNTKNKLLASQKTHHSLQSCKKDKRLDERSWLSVTANNITCLPTSKSQAVNIRIVRHRRGM